MLEILHKNFQHLEGFFDAFVFSPQLVRIETTSRFNRQGEQIGQTTKLAGQKFEMVKCHLMAKEPEMSAEVDPRMAVFGRWKEVNLGTMDKIIEPLDVLFSYEDSESNVQSSFEVSKDVDVAVSVQEFFLLSCLAAEWRYSRKQEPVENKPPEGEKEAPQVDTLLIHRIDTYLML